MSSRAQEPAGHPHVFRHSTVASALVLLVMLASAAALAARTLHLAEDELICDSERILCVDGTLGYDVNDRLLWLRGRVQSTTVPGVLQITVKGSNGLGHVRYAPMEIELRGHASEIVDFEMIPDYPDVANWSIDHVVFVPAGDESREQAKARLARPNHLPGGFPGSDDGNALAKGRDR